MATVASVLGLAKMLTDKATSLLEREARIGENAWSTKVDGPITGLSQLEKQLL